MQAYIPYIFPIHPSSEIDLFQFGSEIDLFRYQIGSEIVLKDQFVLHLAGKGIDLFVHSASRKIVYIIASIKEAAFGRLHKRGAGRLRRPAPFCGFLY